MAADALRLLVDVALLISVAELLWSLWRLPPGGRRAALLANLGAGLALMLGLRLSLSEPGPAGHWAILACLALAGLSHLIDVRLRGSAGRSRSKPA
ncbi:PIN domain-containing protein [Leptothrix discophora]|uniref:Uncharacterized protein n=1 Tax=Leptothrix discophora TaxID=89 RepID=A0ABT9G4J8_LEPDI|nr:hypothetical protein [Leptothrix discophora]MDP4301384.1 hypothetical protein [Leptothrix discophora]